MSQDGIAQTFPSSLFQLGSVQLGSSGNTLGETQVRGSPRAHPGITPGSPRLTSAAPDGGERRRPMLTR